MKLRNHEAIAVALLTVVTMGMALRQPLFGQAPNPKGGGGKGGPGGFGKGAPPAPLPTVPTAVTLPTLSEKVTGPGAMFDTGKAHWTNRDANSSVMIPNFGAGHDSHAQALVGPA